jgi:hypothetical protein
MVTHRHHSRSGTDQVIWGEPAKQSSGSILASRPGHFLSSAEEINRLVKNCLKLQQHSRQTTLETLERITVTDHGVGKELPAAYLT